MSVLRREARPHESALLVRDLQEPAQSAGKHRPDLGRSRPGPAGGPRDGGDMPVRRRHGLDRRMQRRACAWRANLRMDGFLFPHRRALREGSCSLFSPLLHCRPFGAAHASGGNRSHHRTQALRAAVGRHRSHPLRRRDAGPATEPIHGRGSEASASSLCAAFKASGIEPHPAKAIIAYEPMWAISTSGSHLTIEPEEAVAAHEVVRALLDELFGPHFGEAISVIFGGSLDAANAAPFLNGRPSTVGWSGPARKRRRVLRVRSRRSTPPGPERGRGLDFSGLRTPSAPGLCSPAHRVESASDGLR